MGGMQNASGYCIVRPGNRMAVNQVDGEFDNRIAFPERYSLR